MLNGLAFWIIQRVRRSKVLDNSVDAPLAFCFCFFKDKNCICLENFVNKVLFSTSWFFPTGKEKQIKEVP